MRFLRHACQTSDFGLACLTAGQSVPANAAIIGFTAPTTTYDRMRSLQGEAAHLDANVQLYIPKASPLYAAWTAWYRDSWGPFYKKYASEDYSTWSRLGAAFSSDDLATMELQYENQFRSLLDDYNRQPTAQGHSQSPSTPNTADQARGASGTFALPWWFWVGTTVAVGGVGYFLYQRYKGVQETNRYIREHPEIVAKLASL